MIGGEIVDGFDANRKYKSMKIPEQQQFKLDGTAIELPHAKAAEPVSLDDGMFYEIEYDSCPIPGVGKFVLKSQKIQEPEKDEKRELFYQMRELARAYPSTYSSSKFYDQRVQHSNAIVFYKQAVFMKDVTDDYSGYAPYSQYFPCYQKMGYEQLRTYFTWRTRVRKKDVTDISLSYAFLYIYELLANIGVSSPEEGLDQLMFFWRSFRSYNQSIDKYVLRWLKDYHIYYELPHSFREFVDANKLLSYYPDMADAGDSFDLFCSISKYDIRKSAFYKGDNVKLIRDCFSFLTDRLKQLLADKEISFDEVVFQPTRKMSEWRPFRDALFHPWLRQRDRRIVLSDHEIYLCSHNKWVYSSVITSESGRQLIGYLMKQMEAALRGHVKYKAKLTANINTVAPEIIDLFHNAGLPLEKLINDTVSRFYREATKTIVRVDQAALSRIRQESLLVQEKLIVPEEESLFALDRFILPEQESLFVQDRLILPEQESPILLDIPPQAMSDLSFTAGEDKPPMLLSPEALSSPLSESWMKLKNELSQTELKALSLLLHGEQDIKKYADECGVMLEVLMDGINEKAMDLVGDSLLDEEFVIYEDYIDEVKELIK